MSLRLYIIVQFPLVIEKRLGQNHKRVLTRVMELLLQLAQCIFIT